MTPILSSMFSLLNTLNERSGMLWWTVTHYTVSVYYLIVHDYSELHACVCAQSLSCV